jgi:hypothetical protein
MQGDAKSCNLKESPFPGCRPYPFYRLMPFNQPIWKPMDDAATASRSYGLQTTDLRRGTGSMATTKKNESLLKSKDVAHILDCSPDDVIDLARKGKLQAIKQGRFWRFRESDIVSYKKRVGSDDLPKIAIGRGRPRKGDG